MPIVEPRHTRTLEPASRRLQLLLNVHHHQLQTLAAGGLRQLGETVDAAAGAAGAQDAQTSTAAGPLAATHSDQWTALPSGRLSVRSSATAGAADTNTIAAAAVHTSCVATPSSWRGV